MTNDLGSHLYNSQKKALALVNEVRTVLHYDPATGLFTWKVYRSGSKGIGQQAGYLNSHGYWELRVLGIRATAHRLAWFYVNGCWPDGPIDHINGDKLDNRIDNLRVVSVLVNQQNMRRAPSNNKSTGLIGASFNPKRGKYVARIRHSGRNHFLGDFKTAEEAHAAYLKAKREYHEGCTI